MSDEAIEAAVQQDLEEVADMTATAEDMMDAQEQALDLSDLLNLLRESILDHELRIMGIEQFLSELMKNIKAEIEQAEDLESNESPEHPSV